MTEPTRAQATLPGFNCVHYHPDQPRPAYREAHTYNTAGRAVHLPLCFDCYQAYRDDRRLR